METLVTTRWLAQELESPDLVVLDASAHLPAAGRDARGEFAQCHIPGARFLDLKALTDPASEVPSALPTRAQFDARMAALGVSPGDRIVLYDNSALRSAARAWFILRRFGMTNFTVLDGGFPKWQAEGHRVAGGEAESVKPSRFASANGRGEAQGEVRYKADILANLESEAEQVVDAREEARFRGEQPDFRAGVGSGHIPGSRNLPFGQLLKADGTFRDKAAIRAAFEDAGVDLERPVVTSCGSGITACVLLLALHLIGHEGALYDGSWSEWGADPGLPIATGEAA